jgi:predicted DNA-binding transcriptional regulator AlpA
LPQLNNIRCNNLDAADLIAALAGLEAGELQSVIASAAGILASRTNGHREESPDELLDVAETAKLLGKSKSWVYHEGKHLPFKINGLGGTPRFSRRGLEKYISDRARR